SNNRLVRPRKEKAALSTNSTWRLKYAMKINAPAHATVEILLNRRKKLSLFLDNICLIKSIVETDESEVSAELTDDIAAERTATIRNPRSTCGASVIIKIGKTKSLALIPDPDLGSGSGIFKSCP